MRQCRDDKIALLADFGRILVAQDRIAYSAEDGIHIGESLSGKAPAGQILDLKIRMCDKTPYEFCSGDEFQKIKTDNKYYFLIVVKGQQRKEAEPGIDMLTFVKGGEGADKSINDMFEVVTFPFRSAEDPSGREFLMLPAFLTIMQEHAIGLTSSEVKAYSSLGATDSKKLRMKQIYFCEDDFAPQVDEKTIKSLDEDIFVEGDDIDPDDVFAEGKFNAVVSYVVAPSEPVNGSVCYKLLIGADDHKLYWFKKHKISARQGAGFLESDLKAIKLLRK